MLFEFCCFYKLIIDTLYYPFLTVFSKAFFLTEEQTSQRQIYINISKIIAVYQVGIRRSVVLSGIRKNLKKTNHHQLTNCVQDTLKNKSSINHYQEIVKCIEPTIRVIIYLHSLKRSIFTLTLFCIRNIPCGSSLKLYNFWEREINQIYMLTFPSSVICQFLFLL